MSADYRNYRDTEVKPGIYVVTSHKSYDTIRDFESGYLGPQTPQVDPVVESVREELLSRSQVGIRKYNTTLARTDIPLKQWLQLALEEALDFSVYIKRILMEMDNVIGDK